MATREDELLRMLALRGGAPAGKKPQSFLDYAGDYPEQKKPGKLQALIDMLGSKLDPEDPERLRDALRTTGEIMGVPLSVLPGIGDLMSGADAYTSAREGKWGRAALSAAGALPVVPSLGKLGKPIAEAVGEAGTLERSADELADINRAQAAAHNAETGSTFTPQGQNMAGVDEWSVARPGFEKTVPSKTLTPEDVAAYRREQAAALGDPGAHLGTWQEGETSVLDSPTLIKGVPAALKAGEKGKQRAIFGLKDMLQVDLARTHAMDRLRGVTSRVGKHKKLVQEMLEGGAPQDIENFEKMNKGVRETTVRNYASAPEPSTLAAGIMAGGSARGWYRSTAEAIQSAFGPEAKRFAAVLAALSPQKDVPANVKQALHVFSDWQATGRTQDPKELMKILRASAAKTGVPYYGNETNNAIHALTAHVDDIGPGFISGPKADPFYQNVMGELDALTNDSWMARLYGTKKTGVTAPSRQLAQRMLMGNALKDVEQTTGLKGLQRAEGQETGWSFIRGASNAAKRGTQQGDITEMLLAARRNPEQIHAGGRTLEGHIRNADAISDLLAHPDNAELLALAGGRAPTYKAAEGLVGAPPLAALLEEPDTFRKLAMLAQRANASFAKKPYYALVPALGAGAAATRLPASGNDPEAR